MKFNPEADQLLSPWIQMERYPLWSEAWDHDDNRWVYWCPEENIIEIYVPVPFDNTQPTFYGPIIDTYIEFLAYLTKQRQSHRSN